MSVCPRSPRTPCRAGLPSTTPRSRGASSPARRARSATSPSSTRAPRSTCRAEPERELEARGEDRPFSESLARPGISLIAEHKRRSPSAGQLGNDLSVTDVVEAYERGGAAALSILTERHHFGGSLDDLREARR